MKATLEEQLEHEEEQLLMYEREEKAAVKRQEDADKEANKLKRQFEEEIAKIDKVFKPTIRRNQKQAETWKDCQKLAREQIQELKQKIVLRDATASNLMTPDAVKAWCNLNGLELDHWSDVKAKPVLSNGVSIFKALARYDYDLWLAFKGMDFVGMSIRRKAEHRGDETTPFSYINGIDDKHRVWFNVPDRWGGGTHKASATFTQWKSILEKKEKFFPIVVTAKLKKQFNEHEGWY